MSIMQRLSNLFGGKPKALNSPLTFYNFVSGMKETFGLSVRSTAEEEVTYQWPGEEHGYSITLKRSQQDTEIEVPKGKSTQVQQELIDLYDRYLKPWEGVEGIILPKVTVVERN